MSVVGLPPFPSGGVLLVALQKLRDIILPDNSDYTTTEVCDNIVKPWTVDKQYSLYELIQKDFFENPHPELGLLASEAIGPHAMVFVSHAWRYRFQDLVSALETFFDENESYDKNTTYLWVDLFLNNQHTAPSLPFEWWSSVFRDAIDEIGHTCLVLNPWKSPIPLTRVWCLWEIFCTCSTGAQLTVQLSSDDQASFTETLCSDMNSVVFSMSEIDVERSEAWNPLDRERIFAAIAATPGGFRAVNMRVMNEMRDWVLNTAQDLLDRLHADPDYAFGAMKVGNQLSLLYKQYGNYSRAEELVRRVLLDMERLVPSDHPVLFTTMNNHASLLLTREKYDEAEVLFRRAFEGKRSALGEAHPETMQVWSNLGTSQLKQGRRAEAEKTFREVLEMARNAYGTDTPMTISAMSNLAVGMEDMKGNREEVLTLSRAAHDASARVMGESHPSTLECLNNLGTVLLELFEKAEEAEEVHRRCLGLRERVLGERHPDTQESVSNLCAALRRQGDHKETEATALAKRYYSMVQT